MLQMPAQLNSFHNCCRAGHDEREKDFCSNAAFSMGLHPCEGCCSGKGSWRGVVFSFLGTHTHVITSVFSVWGELQVNVLQGEAFLWFSIEMRAAAMPCVCVCVECS